MLQAEGGYYGGRTGRKKTRLEDMHGRPHFGFSGYRDDFRRLEATLNDLMTTSATMEEKNQEAKLCPFTLLCVTAF